MANRIERDYASYYRAAYGSDPIPGKQMVETRRAFMAGAAATFARTLEISDYPEDMGVRKVDDIHRELEAFRHKVEKGEV